MAKSLAVRVDDRLIHGQVVTQWVKVFKAQNSPSNIACVKLIVMFSSSLAFHIFIEHLEMSF